LPAITLAGTSIGFGLGFAPRSDRERPFMDEVAHHNDRGFEIRNYYYQQLGDILTNGWSSEATPAFDQWLDTMFKDKWHEHLDEIVKPPLGVVENPRNATINTLMPGLENVRTIGQLLAARALQLQARGDHEGGLRHIATVLALSRNLRNKAVFLSHLIGVAQESVAMQSLNQWLAGVGADQKLLRRALEELDRHERGIPPLSDVYKAEYLVTQNSLSEVYRWLDENRPVKHDGGLQELLRFVGSVPWEQKRRERILNAIYAGWLRGADMEYYELQRRPRKPGPRDVIDDDWIPPTGDRAASVTEEKLNDLFRESWLRVVLGSFGKGREVQARSQFNVRSMRIKVAALLYQVEFGKQPEKLTDLTPRFLAQLPTDPFTGRAFDYEVITEKHQPNNPSPSPTIVEGTVVDANVGDAIISSPARASGQGARHVIVPRLKKR
jgi:hypothetical protein